MRKRIYFILCVLLTLSTSFYSCGDETPIDEIPNENTKPGDSTDNENGDKDDNKDENDNTTAEITIKDNIIDFGMNWENFYTDNIVGYIKSLQENPFELITLIIDLAIVIFLIYSFLKIVKGSRAWQLIKGIVLLIVITWLSGLFNLQILNWILTGIMNLGVIAIIVIFQPELRRGLEQLGTNKFTKFFGIDKDLATKTKEDIYKIVIAAVELSKSKIGALIVIERDIKIQDVISSGIPMNADVSPQLLVNIFEPKTPLHDGAVIISGNKIAAAACVLPLADDNDIAKELGTRHRAAIGISKESDSIVVVVSEETGKISIAKDGTLIADVSEDALKKILISNVVTKRFAVEKRERRNKIKEIREKLHKEKQDVKSKEEDEKKE